MIYRRKLIKISIKIQVINMCFFPIPDIFGISIYKFVNKCLINDRAWVTLSALKNIQAKTVKENVSKIFTNSIILGKTFPSATISKWVRFLFNNNRGKKYSAFKTPQIINVQFAPCQNPLIIKIINMFLIFLFVLPLLPPNGIYK